MKTWLFWDWWHIEHQDNVALRQGRPKWQPGGTYEDPSMDYLACWPTVYRDTKGGKWRLLYPISGFPMSLMGAESDDGIHWEPMNRPDIQPPGEKIAPNHLYTVERANGGPVYCDERAVDGFPLKFFCVQRGGPVAERARLDPGSYFHEIVTGEGVKPYMAENLVVRSRDGLHWEVDEEGNWATSHWHPDPPMMTFFNRQKGRHVMITRPGWGDRRVLGLESEDARSWGDLRVLLQPDPVDPPQIQFYGMPVHYYEGTYVGFLYLARFMNAERLHRFNQLWGPIESQLTYSFDGEHWQRGLRESFIPLNEPGEPGSGVLYPTALIEEGDELRIYSASTPDLHHQYAENVAAKQFIRKGQVPPSAILLHTLRKDGFMYLESKGNWATFISKPLVLLEAKLSMNALGPHGEVFFQLTDLLSEPLEGYRFDDCEPLIEVDELAAPLRWKGRSLEPVTRNIVRLEVKFRHTRIYAIRGDFHFADALDVALLEDGKDIDPTLFDF